MWVPTLLLEMEMPMRLPIQVTFRDVEESPAVRRLILAEAEKLDQFFPRIMGCRVLVESPHRRHHKGRLYHVRIDLTIPGKELVVRRDPAEHAPHTDLYLAIENAFHEMRRQLQDYVRIRRGQEKYHDPLPRGKVMKLFPYEEYGFLEGVDKGEVYFHKNSVLNNAFGRLTVGSEIRFHEEMGEQGPQASTVELVGTKNRRGAPPKAA